MGAISKMFGGGQKPQQVVLPKPAEPARMPTYDDKDAMEERRRRLSKIGTGGRAGTDLSSPSGAAPTFVNDMLGQ